MNLLLCRLGACRDIPLSSRITSLMSMPLFDSEMLAQAEDITPPVSPTQHSITRRIFSAPDLEYTVRRYLDEEACSNFSGPTASIEGEAGCMGHPHIRYKKRSFPCYLHGTKCALS